jgi:hypothetical protein
MNCQEGQAVMLRQVFHAARQALAPGVSRRADQHQLGVFQLAGNHAAVLQRALTDGEVEILRRQVDVAVADVQIHAHCRITFGELLQQRGQAVMAKRGGCADADASRDFAAFGLHGAFGIVNQRQRCARLLHVKPASVGEAEAARGPAQKLRAKARFQPGQRAADDRGRGGQGYGRCRQRTAFNDGNEGFDVAQVVVFPAHYCL